MKQLINNGRMVDPVEGITPEDVTIESLAACLSKICRYNGHCNRFYSVAEHCYVAALWAMDVHNDARIALACLLHDAAEAYTGDIVTPFKKSIPGIDDAEALILEVVASKYQVSIADSFNKLEREVDEIDRSLLAFERNMFMPYSPDWVMDMPNLPPSVHRHFYIGPELIGEMPWQEAEKAYVIMALKLLKEVGDFG